MSEQAPATQAPVPCASPHAMHAPPHQMYPALHATPQLTPSQVALPLGSVGQAPQLAPQVATAVLDTQAPPQSCVPRWQSHWWVAAVQVRPGRAAQSASTAQPLLHAPLPRSQ